MLEEGAGMQDDGDLGVERRGPGRVLQCEDMGRGFGRGLSLKILASPKFGKTCPSKYWSILNSNYSIIYNRY